jgi:hypothetical protein
MRCRPVTHPAEQHQMFIADLAVLTQEAGELSMKPGVGIHEGLVLSQPQTVMAPCPPNDLRPIAMHRLTELCPSVRPPAYCTWLRLLASAGTFSWSKPGWPWSPVLSRPSATSLIQASPNERLQRTMAAPRPWQA